MKTFEIILTEYIIEKKLFENPTEDDYLDALNQFPDNTKEVSAYFKEWRWNACRFRALFLHPRG